MPVAASRLAFVDDSPEFLDLVEQRAQERGLPVRTTQDPAECLAWVERGEVDEIIADLRMPEDGLTVLEEAQRIADIEGKVWTVFQPTDEEKRRAKELGLKITTKTHLNDFLDEALRTPEALDPYEVQRLRNRVRRLERVHQEWVDDLVSKLEEIPDLERAVISSERGGFTVAELVDDIRNMRPRGVEYVRLWRRAIGTLLKIRRKP